MANSWPKKTIDQLKASTEGAIAIGPFGSRMKANVYTPTGVPVIRGTNLSDTRTFRGEFVYVSDQTADSMKNCNVFADDLVFPHRGSIGQVGIVPRDNRRYMLSTSLMKLSCDQTMVDPLYLFYFFRSDTGRHELLKNASTVGTPGIGQPLTSLRAIGVPLPSLPTQKRIADILGTLDDKIELNRQMNETLEAMALRLFKSWFIDFDAVHAKAAVRREHPKLSNADLSRRALPNMAPEIAELFPDTFEESTLGPIPKGWTIGRLCEHTDAQKGLSYKGTGLSDTGLPLHNLNSVLEGGGYKFEGIKYYSGEFKDRHIIRPGEVIVANTEQGHDCLLLGYAAIVPHSFGDEGLFSHHIFRLRIRPESPLRPEFLCRLLNSQRMHDLVSGYGNGTTVNMLPIDGVEQPQFVVPPQKLILAFDALAANVRAREIRFVDENRRLARTRDLLLPRLLAGQLRIG